MVEIHGEGDGSAKTLGVAWEELDLRAPKGGGAALENLDLVLEHLSGLELVSGKGQFAIGEALVFHQTGALEKLLFQPWMEGGGGREDVEGSRVRLERLNRMGRRTI